MSSRGRALVIAMAMATAIASHARAAVADPPAKAGPDPLVPYPPPTPRVLQAPDRTWSYTQPQPYPSLPWILLQLVPSPEIVVGKARAAGTAEESTRARFGMRWQLTPVLWSWGTNRRVSRWRFLVVDPLARHSGSLELSGSFEYIFGDVDRMIVRPGVRAYFPLVERGQYLSASMGTSTYAYDQKLRVAYDVGAYVLSGLFGIQATVAPDNGPLSAIGTFSIRYF